MLESRIRMTYRFSNAAFVSNMLLINRGKFEEQKPHADYQKKIRSFNDSNTLMHNYF